MPPAIAAIEVDSLMKEINVQFIYTIYVLFVLINRKNMKQAASNMGKPVTSLQKSKVVLTKSLITSFRLLMTIVVQIGEIQFLNRVHLKLYLLYVGRRNVYSKALSKMKTKKCVLIV